MTSGVDIQGEASRSVGRTRRIASSRLLVISFSFSFYRSFLSAVLPPETLEHILGVTGTICVPVTPRMCSTARERRSKWVVQRQWVRSPAKLDAVLWNRRQVTNVF